MHASAACFIKICFYITICIRTINFYLERVKYLTTKLLYLKITKREPIHLLMLDAG